MWPLNVVFAVTTRFANVPEPNAALISPAVNVKSPPIAKSFVTVPELNVKSFATLSSLTCIVLTGCEALPIVSANNVVTDVTLDASYSARKF